MAKMRAKLKLNYIRESISTWANDTTKVGDKLGEFLQFNAVCASNYGTTGEDENNTYAKWSPSAQFEINVANPALWGQFKVGEEYYVDFTLATPAAEVTNG